ncbi:N-acetyl-gamma-glutamyl-phosphate reductase [hydrothermal vent metagenome]|uniref:N-acetyl-gamma-glutamyl-phosphate reductase n=1 Tax=hydrothermal vent metagenome TaxID=652676 RepID=A0A3B0TVP5_9ZZZZ
MVAAKVFIDGEAGTTGLQIRERLAGRRDIELLSIPDARRKDTNARAELLNSADIAILCLPDEAARQSVDLIKNTTTRVIDASSAFRVAKDWAYGFAEMSKTQAMAIAKAKRVSNPGCYPQGPIALLRPLVAAGLVPAGFGASVNAISGYSGGGRKMIENYQGMGESAPVFQPYALDFVHKHVPEMTLYCGLDKAPLFTPAVGRYYQGMLGALPLQMGEWEKIPSGKELHTALGDYYSLIKDGFVELADFVPGQKQAHLDPESLNGTNKMRLYVFANDDQAQALLVAVYDNLGKGAAGAAVQNLNLMIGANAKTSL